MADADTGEEIAWGRAVNLSMNGVLVVSPKPPADGTLCAVTLEWRHLEGAPVIFAMGYVARSGDGRCGIELTEMPIESYEHLAAVVEAHRKSPDQLLDSMRNEIGLLSGTY